MAEGDPAGRCPLAHPEGAKPVLVCHGARQSESGDFVILGQVFSYPKTWKGLLAWLVFCLTIAVVILIGLVYARGENIAIFGSWVRGSSIDRFVINERGERVRYDTYQVAFWTPSPETEKSFRPGRSTSLPRWQLAVDDKKVDHFGDELRKIPMVNGYRRWAVIGHGQTDYKAGYWWVVALDKNVTVEQVMHVYRDYWTIPGSEPGSKPENIYVEVLPPGDFGYRK